MADLGQVVIMPRGKYDPIMQYSTLDMVEHKGSSYIAKQTTVGNEPSEQSEYWQLLSKGIEGLAGNLTTKEFGKYALDAAMGAELKKYVSDGKKLVANAITEKGQATDENETFQLMAEKVKQIQTGVDTSGATATSDDILSGKTAWVNGMEVTGKIPIIAGVYTTLGCGQLYTIPAGYHNGKGRIYAKPDVEIKKVCFSFANAPGEVIFYDYFLLDISDYSYIAVIGTLNGKVIGGLFTKGEYKRIGSAEYGYLEYNGGVEMADFELNGGLRTFWGELTFILYTEDSVQEDSTISISL